MIRVPQFIFIFTLAFFAARVAFAQSCATSPEAIRALMNGHTLQSRYVERVTDGGQGLQIQVTTLGNQVFLTFSKPTDGLWAQGPVEFCKDGDTFVATIAKSGLKIGRGAPGIVKFSMSHRARFRMTFFTGELLHVSVTGWRGDFGPALLQ